MAEVLVQLDQRLRGTDQFFRQANVMLNLGEREVNEAEFSALQEVLARYGLIVTAVEAQHTDTRSFLRGLGLAVELSEQMSAGETSRDDVPAAVPASSLSTPPLTGSGLVIHKTLRSGQTVRHEGDICLIGEVNPGAEVVAGDNVIVWGSLRGVVQAGIYGNEAAVVCALDLAPTQLRIASLVTRQPEAAHAQVGPEMARIHDGQIIVEQWLPRSRRFGRLR